MAIISQTTRVHMPGNCSYRVMGIADSFFSTADVAKGIVDNAIEMASCGVFFIDDGEA